MKQKPFHKQKRKKILIRITFLLILTVSYTLLLSYLPGYAEAIKYFAVLSPVMLLIALIIVLDEQREYVQKGITGENKVESLLNKYHIHSLRNYTLPESKFDLDFIFKRNNKHYLIEVKNYEKISYSKLNQTLSQTKANAAKLKEANNYKWVEPIVISVGKLPKDYSKENVYTLESFEKFLTQL